MCSVISAGIFVQPATLLSHARFLMHAFSCTILHVGGFMDFYFLSTFLFSFSHFYIFNKSPSDFVTTDLQKKLLMFVKDVEKAAMLCVHA